MMRGIPSGRDRTSCARQTGSSKYNACRDSALESRLPDLHAKVALRESPHCALELVLEADARPSKSQVDLLSKSRGVERQVDGEGDEEEGEIAEVLVQALRA